MLRTPPTSRSNTHIALGNKAVVCALSASYVSTFAGYPVSNSFSKTRVTVPKLAMMVYREEGIMGFYRGLWIPLMTISFVRKSI